MVSTESDYDNRLLQTNVPYQLSETSCERPIYWHIPILNRPVQAIHQTSCSNQNQEEERWKTAKDILISIKLCAIMVHPPISIGQPTILPREIKMQSFDKQTTCIQTGKITQKQPHNCRRNLN